MSIALCTSCQEQDLVYDSPMDSGNIIDVHMDSLLIYQKQINHGEMLNNLIRSGNGKFYLDLSVDDAEKLGISLSEYDNIQNFADRTWVEITGTISKGKYHNQTIPIIKIKSLNKIEKPNNEFVPPPSDTYIPTSSTL